ncbi:hypothetical protein HDV05_004834 [Chytridiales sp. JEL 0842]|nr:hypothetical protein HDV05_004834 [Chytridiales sp. JEL 0842]
MTYAVFLISGLVELFAGVTVLLGNPLKMPDWRFMWAVNLTPEGLMAAEVFAYAAIFLGGLPFILTFFINPPPKQALPLAFAGIMYNLGLAAMVYNRKFKGLLPIGPTLETVNKVVPGMTPQEARDFLHNTAMELHGGIGVWYVVWVLGALLRRERKVKKE